MNTVVIRTVGDLRGLHVETLGSRPEPQRILMCSPEFYDVIDIKNVHMEGNVGRVDRAEARAEWYRLRQAFEAAGHQVVVIEGVPGLEDMVFAANQVLPGMGPAQRPYVLLSSMLHESRQREVPYYRDWFERRGYRIIELMREPGGEAEYFEGQGDGIWHPGRQLLWGGYGQRTSLKAYEHISAALDVPVIALELRNPSFYHLDTCFCVLNAETVLIFPGAFAEEGRRLIAEMFPRVIEVSPDEALRNFACNGVALDGRTVILQSGARETVARLRKEGFRPVEVETGEFMKSGGSVFCLKMMIY